MRLDKRRLIPILLAVFIFSISLIMAQQRESKDDNTIRNFQVTDVPNDDGTGLMLSWEPLDRSKRIIEYRIYRGITPDQLFFLESIQVNPKSPVVSDQMFYYDNSASEILDASFPGKLRLEKDQPDDGILYRRPPRDLKFTATLLEKYQMISLAERKQFYYRSREIIEEFDESGNSISSYAGLKSNQQTILALLKPGETYYYTVVAVDERQRMLPHAPVTAGVPVPNSPEASPALYSVVMPDTGELRFEWEYPIYKDALTQYRILQVNDIPSQEWEELSQDPDAVLTNARVIASGQVGAGSLPNYTKVEVGEEIDSYRDAVFTLQLIDYYGASSLSPISRPRVLNSDALPPRTDFYVEDKPNDKGDRLTVIWDNPIVFVIKVTSLNAENSKLRINYQLNKTETQKVDNMWFDFYDPETGDHIEKIKEFYQDNSVIINLPDGYDFKKGLRVKITLSGIGLQGADIPEDYVIEQYLKYEPAMITLVPSNALYRNGVDVSKVYNVVYRKYMHSPMWRLVMRNTSFDNSLDVVVPYNSMVQKMVYGISYTEGDSLVMFMNTPSGIERKSRALRPGDHRGVYALMDHTVDFTWDNDNQVMVRTSIFDKAALKMHEETINRAQTRLEELQQLRVQTTDAATLEEIDAEIAKQEAILNAYTQNPIVDQAFAAGSNRSRIRHVLKAYDDFMRRQSFIVVKTDAHGLFVESEPEMIDGELVYHMPISNWFDNNKYVTLFTTILFCLIVVVFVQLAKRGKDLYIRPIAGLQEIDNAIGRATEMGRPMLYCMGNGSISDVATIASMGILGLVAKKAAEYDTKLIVPCYDYIIMPIAQEIVREAHYAVGRPDTYDRNNVFYLTNVQFAYVAGVNGIMIREHMATNFFMGYFAAEALLMTETGNSVGAVQIAGTDAITQIPFFITTCDYTLIGEELYAASAYLNREPMLLGTLKAQDYFKFVILTVVIIGAVLSSFQITGLTLLMPEK
nr:hypothetical protein [Candidatus Cloacimonadota bacterium]